MDLDIITIGATAFDPRAQELLLRGGLVVFGLVALLHFCCMGSKSEDLPWLDVLLISGSAFAGFCAALAGLIAPPLLAALAALLLAAMPLLFMLRLWVLGFYVSQFYKERGRS
jgi:hypothetical protein